MVLRFCFAAQIVHSLFMSRPQSQKDTYNDSTHFFLLSPAEVARRLESDIEHGLSTSTAAARHSQHGPNQLAGGGGVSPWGILAAQIFNAMILVLIICLAVSLGIQSWIESGVIAGVIIINVNMQAQKTMDSLRSLASPTAQVIRDSKSVTVPSGQVTIGDLVELKTGDVVPADLRLVEAMNFETDEALLTGESLPVAKDVNATWDAKGEDGLKLDPRDIGVGDRITIAYTSSTVTKGRAKGVVISIGMNTEIGAIAKSLRGGDTRVRKVRRNEDGHAPWHRYFSSWGLTVADTIGSFLGTNVGTPLHRTLSWLAITLFCVAGVFAGFCFAANNGNTDREIILYAIATGLSMIPASLVVVLTITLSGGTKAMVRRSVIVRKMDALEALGAVTDICSDKTGTVRKMVCKAAWIPSRGTVLVGESSEAFNPRSGDLSFVPHSPAESAILEVAGNISSASSVTAAELVKTHQAPLEAVLNIVSMCGVAKVFESGDGWIARGDPTEAALQIFAHRFGWGRERWTAGEEPQWTQLWEYPFDSDLKRMSVVYTRHSDEKQFVFMKGAVERVIDACADVQTAEGRVPLDADMEATILANVEALAEQGLRVLGLAQKSWQPTNGEPERADVENAMTLQGLVGLYDPPRPETQGAVRAAHHAGIQVHMLTGDHAATARAIALQVGILPRNIGTLSKESIDAMVMTAAQFDKLSEDEIDALPILPLVVARCAPNTKVRMVDALHRRKAFAAMTGDGVNDSPSLKRADVGIAMGLSGSDVAKDASDIVLTDDNFASILNAVEEGRRIFDNICKFVLHLLAGNVMQALVLLVGLSFKDNTNLSVFPLTPIEILWIIMITSSFPAMGLGAQCASPDVMRRKPHDLKVGVFSKEVLADMMWYGVSGAGCCLSVFTLIVWGWGNGNLGIDSNNSIGDGSDLVFRARSATFATMTWICLLLAFEVMDMRRSFFRMKPKTEYPLTQWARDVWVNRFLLWSVIGGFISVFPLIYIPKLNTVVFKHAPITWEIALSFVSVLVFIVLAELWKLSKRVYLRHMYKWSDEDDEEMGGVFAAWKTMDVSYTQAEGEGRVAV
ncbi:sodium transport ATPase 5 [Mycena rebaudengoi]|nr:sodium transport ATPase 5 [Mycena rebaudengoi]